jgi:adenine deaminase
MLSIPEFARNVVPLGTTSVVADPHEIGNVLGLDGIRYILESSEGLPLRVFVMFPSCVPAIRPRARSLAQRIWKVSRITTIGLGGMMNYRGSLWRTKSLQNKGVPG